MCSMTVRVFIYFLNNDEAVLNVTGKTIFLVVKVLMKLPIFMPYLAVTKRQVYNLQ